MPRFNNLTDFKGNPYQTDVDVRKQISDALGDVGASPVIDPETKNLRTDLQPIEFTSNDYASGGLFDVGKIKFIGNCKLTDDGKGNLVLRIGDNLNSSNWNSTDGQTDATAASAYPASSSVSVAPGVLTGDGDGGSYPLLRDTGTVTASTAEDDALVHFENATDTYFALDVTSGGVSKRLYFGKVSANGEYAARDGSLEGEEVDGVSMTVSSFGEETKSAEGATGYCGSVSFSVSMASLRSLAGEGSATVSIEKISHVHPTEGMFEYGFDGKTFAVFNSADASIVPSVGSVSYAVKGTAKVISGVTYYTTASTVTVNASGVKNVGYPANGGTKIDCDSEGGSNWFSDFTSNSTDEFTSWNTSLDAEMSWQSAAKTLNKGVHDTPTAEVAGVNANATGTAKLSPVGEKLLVCDANGSVTSSSGSILESSRLQSDLSTAWDSDSILGDSDLQVYDKQVVYPSTDFTGYNGVADQPDYSSSSGTRHFYVKLAKTGTVMGGTVTLTTTVNPSTVSGFKVELSGKQTSPNWMDITKNSANGGIGTTFSWGTTSKIGFSIPQSADYGDGCLYARVTMTGTGVGLKNIELA